MKNNLAKYRGKHNLTQAELGKLCGVSRAQISYIEKHHLSVENALRFSKILNENPIDLLNGDILTFMPRNEEEKEKIIQIVKGL